MDPYCLQSLSIPFQGCRLVPEKHVRKQSATDGTLRDLNIGVSPGFGGLMKRAKSTTLFLSWHITLHKTIR